MQAEKMRYKKLTEERLEQYIDLMATDQLLIEHLKGLLISWPINEGFDPGVPVDEEILKAREALYRESTTVLSDKLELVAEQRTRIGIELASHCVAVVFQDEVPPLEVPVPKQVAEKKCQLSTMSLKDLVEHQNLLAKEITFSGHLGEIIAAELNPDQ